MQGEQPTHYACHGTAPVTENGIDQRTQWLPLKCGHLSRRTDPMCIGCTRLERQWDSEAEQAADYMDAWGGGPLRAGWADAAQGLKLTAALLDSSTRNVQGCGLPPLSPLTLSNEPRASAWGSLFFGEGLTADRCTVFKFRFGFPEKFADAICVYGRKSRLHRFSLKRAKKGKKGAFAPRRTARMARWRLQAACIGWFLLCATLGSGGKG